MFTVQSSEVLTIQRSVYSNNFLGGPRNAFKGEVFTNGGFTVYISRPNALLSFFVEESILDSFHPEHIVRKKPVFVPPFDCRRSEPVRLPPFSFLMIRLHSRS